MVIPMPAINMGGCPSEYALSCRPKIMFLIGLQFTYSIGLMFSAGQPQTALSLIVALTACLGTYAIKDSIDGQMIMFWGIMGLFNGISALAGFVDAYFRMGAVHALFSGYFWPTWDAFVALIGAPAMMCPVYFAYSLYQDANNPSAATGSSSSYGRASRSESQSLVGRPTARQSSFQVFQGSGHRLADV